MSKTRRILALLLVCLMVVSITACGKDAANNNTGTNSPASTGGGNTGGGGNASTDSGGSGNSGNSSDSNSTGSGGGASNARDTLNIAIAMDPGTLSPVATGGEIMTVLHLLLEPLWDVDSNQNISWLLATNVDEVAPDNWIVHLREGVTFSNGNPFTTEDILFSIQLYKNAGATGGPRVQSVDAEATKAIDDHTLDLRFLDFHVSNWTILSDFVIYDAESYDAEKISIEPVGTGPYVLSEYVVNSHTFLERREDYWGEKPETKNLKFRMLSETSQVVNSLETGAIDIGAVATQDYNYVNGLSAFNLKSYNRALWTELRFNAADKSIFNHNYEARLAVCHAIDRQAIIDLVYEGHAVIMNSAVPPYVFDHEARFDNMHEIYSVGYNVELAKKYAESSGLVGKDVVIITSGSAPHVQIAEIMQSMLNAIGVNLIINNYDGATVSQMMGDLESTYGLVLVGAFCPNLRVADPLVNGVRYSTVLSKPNAWDVTDKGVEYYLDLAPKALSTPDAQERSDITYEVLGMFINQIFGYPICDITYTTAFTSDLDINSAKIKVSTGTLMVRDLKWAK